MGDNESAKPRSKTGRMQGATPKRPGDRPGRGPRLTNTFKGETAGMQGHVFEVLGERVTKRQFEDTLEALERYAGETYPGEIALLQPLFKRLEYPKVEAPEPPGMETKIKEIKIEDQDESDESTTGPSEWEKLLYTERVKMFLRQEEALKAALIGIYNVVLG